MGLPGLNQEFFGSAVPWWMVVSLRNRFYLENFVELGAGYGATSLFASSLFPRIVCVELSPDIYAQQIPPLRSMPSVTSLLGHSVELLPKILSELRGPSLFYIDSHWPGMGPKLADKECPLLDELALICARPEAARDVLMIDNAGMFLNSPRPPHDPEQWPDVFDIRLAIQTRCALEVALFCDVLIAAPERIVDRWGIVERL